MSRTRVVVADTTPLHYLVLIRRIGLLPCLFTTVHVPTEVYAELANPKTPELVRHWAGALPSWVTVTTVPARAEDALLQLLDDGESAAIALAELIRPDVVLMDERAGVAVAETKGFVVTGTLGILRSAARRGMIDLQAALGSLRATNFHVSQVLLDRLLAEDRERRR